jgi:hypothetical protein
MTAEDTRVECRRVVPFTLTRSEPTEGGRLLEGYAAVFNSSTLIEGRTGQFEEVIAPGAFKKSLQERSPVLMFEHGQHPLYGSMPIGSIQALSEDTTGLYLRARLFDNWLNDPLIEAIGEGAIDGMSFRFETIRDTRDVSRTPELRTLREVKLYELGPVIFPAYADTTLALRSLAAHIPGLTFSMNAEPEAETTEDSTSDDAVTRSDTSEDAAPPDAPAESHSSPSTLAERQKKARQIRFDRRDK